MATSPLPIAIVLPHASLAIPPELVGRIALTEAQIFNEADVYTDLIYDFRDRVAAWHAFPYARSIIDVNRPKERIAMIPEGDGIIKRMTSYGAPVFIEGEEPEDALEARLIETYWQPWHDTMAALAADHRIKLVLDCHSMAAVGPTRYDGDGAIRPRISASNMGDENGEQVQAQLTSSPELVRFAAQAFGNALEEIPDLAQTSTPFAVNQPFPGGPIIWIHGGKAQPWLMIELSRATYIGQQTGDSPVSAPDMVRINAIREALWGAIVAIVEQL